MRRGSTLARHLLIALLGIWLGALVSVGAAAAIAFPTMKRLDPTLPGFAGVNDHWSIAAGSVFEPMFRGVVLAGIVICVLIGILFYFAQRDLKRWWMWVFAVPVLGLIINTNLLRSSQAEMSNEWRQFLQAAVAAEHDPGSAATAKGSRERFERLHPTASIRLKTHAAFVAATLVVAVLCGRRRAQPEPAS